MDLKTYIRDIKDFPKPGILFRDISPLLAAPDAFDWVICQMVTQIMTRSITAIAAVESRGFLFAAPVARELELPLVLIRKKGKLPFDRISVPYSLEYGDAVLEMHTDAVKAGQRVAIIDDVLATGGTAAAAARLIEQVGGVPALSMFLMELSQLGGRAQLGSIETVSLLSL